MYSLLWTLELWCTNVFGYVDEVILLCKELLCNLSILGFFSMLTLLYMVFFSLEKSVILFLRRDKITFCRCFKSTTHQLCVDLSKKEKTHSPSPKSGH
jgi:hypothetical protein